MTKLKLAKLFINNTDVPFRMGDIYKFSRENGFDARDTGNYMSMFKKAEFIERIDRGIYQKVSNVPYDLTTTELKKLAYDSNYRRLVKIKKIMGNGK